MLNFPLPEESKTKSLDIIASLKDFEQSFILRELDTSGVSLMGEVDKAKEENDEVRYEVKKLGKRGYEISNLRELKNELDNEEIKDTVKKIRGEAFDGLQANFNLVMKLGELEDVLDVAEEHNKKIDDIAEERLIRPGKPNLKINNEYRVSIIRK